MAKILQKDLIWKYMYKLFNKKLKNSIVINVAMSLINNKYHFHLFLILNGIWHISEVPLMPSNHQIKNLKKTFAKKLCFRRGLDFFISFGRLLIQLDKKTKQNGKKTIPKILLGGVWQCLAKIWNLGKVSKILAGIVE